MRRSVLVLLACLLALAPAMPATAASDAPRPTLSDIEDEVMCPTCGTALSLSESPLAQRQRVFIQRLIDEGRTEAQIKASLVEEFGPAVLATPPRSGFALAAWLVPLGGLLLVGAGLGIAVARRRGVAPEEGEEAEAEAEAEADFEDLVDADLAGAERR